MNTFINRRLLGLTLLAIIFSASFFFSFIWIPELINKLLLSSLDMPGIDHSATSNDHEIYETFLEQNNLRITGLVCLSIILFLIVLGFMTKRTFLARLGAFAVFLPVFGQYAIGMFFLTGIGVLRVVWLPLIDLNPDILQLGEIIKIPFLIIEYPFKLLGVDIHRIFSLLLICIGSVIFSIGVVNWLQSRTGSEKIATNILYRFSRHPQYLGWLILTYGLMIYSGDINTMKRSWDIQASLPWLIMCMTIIGVCMIEELNMRKKTGESYDEYRASTPFLFPLPVVVERIIRIPAFLAYQTRFPTRKRDIILTILLYTFILIILSIPFTDIVDKSNEHSAYVTATPYDTDSLLAEIRRPQHRRNIHTHFEALERMGSSSFDLLAELVKDSDPVIREFAAISLGHLKATEATASLTRLVSDTVPRVRTEALRALVSIGGDKDLQDILQRAEEDSTLLNHPLFYSYLDITSSKLAVPYFERAIDSDNWAVRSAAIGGLYNINKEIALPLVCNLCFDPEVKARRSAVSILLEAKSDLSVEVLKDCLEDKDAEVRLLAREALELIEKK